MRNRINWWRRDEDGRKYQVELRYFANRLTWHCQPARYESWEPYEPDEVDWERAETDMENRLKRGLVREDIVATVRQQRRDRTPTEG